MAIALDGSAPASKTQTTTAANTTASFTPPAGATILAAVCVGNPPGSGAVGAALSDSLSGTWVRDGQAYIDGVLGYAAVWRRTTAAEGSSMTVTCTPSGTNGKGSQITVFVATGLATNPPAARVVITTGTAGQGSITPSVAGSLIVGALSYSRANIAITAATGTTSDLSTNDATNGQSFGTFHKTDLTADTSAVTVGYSTTFLASPMMIAIEYLPSGVAMHTFDTKASTASTGTNPLTVSLTLGVGTTLLLVYCSARGSTGVITDWTGSVTYDGVALTQIATSWNALSDGTQETANALFYMLNPPTNAAKNLVITVTSAFSASHGYIAASFRAASGESVYEQDFGREATGTNPALASSVTTTHDGCVLFAGIGDGAQTWAPSARSGVQLYDTDAGASGIGAQYVLQSTAGAQAISWTFGTSEDYVIVGGSFYDNMPPPATWKPKTNVMRV
jgi:hypothetical protein